MIKVHIASSRWEEIGRQVTRMAAQMIAQDSEQRATLCSNPEECDVFISVLYDTLLTPDFLSRKRRCYNFHPGILPRYRGCGAYTWAIVNGERETGVTLHEISKGIDDGPRIEEWKYPITEADTAHSLFLRGMAVIRDNFQKVFWSLVTGTHAVTHTMMSGHLYTRKHLREALDLTRMVRAFHYPEKPGLFYINRKGERIELEW